MQPAVTICAANPKFATFAGRAANIDTVYAELARILQTKTTAEWSAILEKADVPVMPMHDLESLLVDPHIVATDFFPVIEHPTEGRIRNMKPCGASSSETAGRDQAAGAAARASTAPKSCRKPDSRPTRLPPWCAMASPRLCPNR